MKNLSNLIKGSSTKEELSILFEEPFEIDVEKSFPIMYEVAFNIKMNKLKLLDKHFKSHTDAHNVIISFISINDYSIERKIVLAGMYNYLVTEKDVSKEHLEPIKNIGQGVLFCNNRVDEIKKIESISKIYDEFSKFEQIREESKNGYDQLYENHETNKIFDTTTFLKELEVKKEQFTYRIYGYNGKLKFKPRHINYKKWCAINRNGIHGFGSLLHYGKEKGDFFRIPQ